MHVFTINKQAATGTWLSDFGMKLQTETLILLAKSPQESIYILQVRLGKVP